MDKTDNTVQKKQAGPTDFLANERTFLAWIRTSIALMGLGFVIVKFALFVAQISGVLEGKVTVKQNAGYSGIIGVILVAVGAVMAALAYVRYINIEKQLRDGNYFPSKWLSFILALSIVIGSCLLLLYLWPNIKL